MDKNLLKGKKICCLGDRDGIPGPALSACAENLGDEILFTSTECFV